MDTSDGMHAFGGPGLEPRWTSSAKEGLGTSYHTSCRLWFTLSHGIVNELYYPHVDQPNTRDFQFLITDGSTFFHEEKRDLAHRIEYPERDCLFYRITNSESNGRYRIIKDVLTDPHRSVLLVHTRVEVNDASLEGRLHLYALLAPHLERFGAGNSGWCTEIGGHKLLRAVRGQTHLVMGCTCGFLRRSVGYVGTSDGWQDLKSNFTMDWEFCDAQNGNIALTGEIDLRRGLEFTLGIAFGRSPQSTTAKLLQSLADPIDLHRNGYVRQWQRTVVNPNYDFSSHTSDGGHLYRLSRCILLAHEDKTFEGALVASMSIPWGETKSDNDLGGYHLVWTRDLVQSTSALLASGQTSTPLRALIWLATMQQPNGLFPQNSWIDGKAYWSVLQLDEIAAPVILAWRLRHHGTKLGLFDPSVMIFRAASYLLLQGPVTVQDRWEENAGYSPSTLATVIAGLVCAAEFAVEYGEPSTAGLILDYADWLNAHVEEWTVTQCGELVDGIPRHYIRITPTDAASPDPHADPDTAQITIANGGGVHPARNIVSGDFLHLVRLGIRAAADPIVRASVDVMDRVLKRDLPQGPCWLRYNHDGYGQKDDGGAFDGAGVGRAWPILTGERGHYELDAGHDPAPFVTAMEHFANAGGMLTEQLWDAPDLPDRGMKRGAPTGAAMPLCWSHAEYITLVRSRHDGMCFDRIAPAFTRYASGTPANHRYEIWLNRHRLRRVRHGKLLRVMLAEEASLSWSDGTMPEAATCAMTRNDRLHIWYADLPTDTLSEGAVVTCTIHWMSRHDQTEPEQFTVTIAADMK